MNQPDFNAELTFLKYGKRIELLVFFFHKIDFIDKQMMYLSCKIFWYVCMYYTMVKLKKLKNAHICLVLVFKAVKN